MRTPEERTTVVTTDNGGGAGLVIALVLAAVCAVGFVFLLTRGDADIDATPTDGIEAPEVDKPDVEINVPKPDVDVNVPAKD